MPVYKVGILCGIGFRMLVQEFDFIEFYLAIYN